MSNEKEPISLLEYEKIYCGEKSNAKHWLPQEEFESLRDYLLNYPTEDDKPPLQVRSDRITAQNYVGAILIPGGRQIEILPKIDLAAGGKDVEAEKDQTKEESTSSPTSNSEESEETKEIKDTRVHTRKIFLQMLMVYLGKHYRQFESGVWGEANLPILEAFFHVFLRDVAMVIQRGLARAYVPHEENLYCLKGKLDFTNQIRHNLVHKERFYVHYDEFSIDRPINRVIKEALRLVRRLTSDSENYRKASSSLEFFHEVSDARDWRHEVQRTNADRSVNSLAYQDAFKWAQILLNELSPDNWKGERETISLLFPMEKVFESYVTEKLQRLSPSNINITAQSSKYRVMEEKRNDGAVNVSFTIMPDMVARKRDKEEEHCIILDTKWKGLDRENTSSKYGISQGDIYQLYSYGKVYRNNDNAGQHTSLVLLYPCNEKFTDEELIEFQEEITKSRDKKLSLKILPVNLARLTSHKQEVRQDAGDKLLRSALSAFPNIPSLDQSTP